MSMPLLLENALLTNLKGWDFKLRGLRSPCIHHLNFHFLKNSAPETRSSGSARSFKQFYYASLSPASPCISGLLPNWVLSLSTKLLSFNPLLGVKKFGNTPVLKPTTGTPLVSRYSKVLYKSKIDFQPAHTTATRLFVNSSKSALTSHSSPK